MKKSTLFFSVIFVLVFYNQAFAGGVNVNLIRVIDGDTICVLHAEKEVKIRLYGIDAPEIGQNHGEEATAFVQDILAAEKSLRVTFLGKDSYGRLIGIVHLGADTLQAILVRHGWAWVYNAYCQQTVCQNWGQLQRTAQVTQVGIWQVGEVVSPWDWRESKKGM